jgi:hypothetical protein
MAHLHIQLWMAVMKNQLGYAEVYRAYVDGLVQNFLKRSTFMVPAPIIAYNMFMNGVDRMDQLGSTNITQRREKRLYMTMFTMCLDLAVYQAFCLYNAMLPNKAKRKHQTLLSFKPQVAQFLVEPELKRRIL